MILKRENDNDKTASYLDMGLAVTENKITSKLYDKINAFNFSVF